MAKPEAQNGYEDVTLPVGYRWVDLKRCRNERTNAVMAPREAWAEWRAQPGQYDQG